MSEREVRGEEVRGEVRQVRSEEKYMSRHVSTRPPESDSLNTLVSLNTLARVDEVCMHTQHTPQRKYRCR